jgi:hypothetical protein
VKSHFYFSKKSGKFIFSDATFFSTPTINKRQTFTDFNDLNALIQQASDHPAVLQTKHKSKLLFSRTFEVVIQPDGDTVKEYEEYITASYSFSDCLVEGYMPLISKKIFFDE